MTGVSELARAVAGHGLPGATSTWPERPLDRTGWTKLLRCISRQRLTGLLVEALAAGDLPATPDQLAAASQLHFERICAVLELESELLPVLDAFGAAGVDARVLKGTAVAHLDFLDPAQRLFADVDLLVRSEHIDHAVRVLGGLGLTRQSVQPRAGFDRRFGKGATFVSTSGREFDLHRTFVMGPYGLRLQLDDLWERSDHFDLGGRQVGALDADCRFLHSCYHTALGDTPPRLVPQRDVAQMLLTGRLDLDRVKRLMRAWQAEPVVARAVRLTWETLGIADITALSTWAQRYIASPRAEKDLAVYIDPDANSYAAKSVAVFSALPRPRDKAAFALAMALPRRGFVPPDELPGRSGRWQRALLSAVRRAARR